MCDNAKPASGCTSRSLRYAENIGKIYRCIGLLNSMVIGGERHSNTSARITVEALDALDCLEQPNPSVSIPGGEPEYAPCACSEMLLACEGCWTHSIPVEEMEDDNCPLCGSSLVMEQRDDFDPAIWGGGHNCPYSPNADIERPMKPQKEG